MALTWAFKVKVGEGLMRPGRLDRVGIGSSGVGFSGKRGPERAIFGRWPEFSVL
jgi:hypothetical protein